MQRTSSTRGSGQWTVVAALPRTILVVLEVLTLGVGQCSEALTLGGFPSAALRESCWRRGGRALLLSFFFASTLSPETTQLYPPWMPSPARE